MDVVPSQSKFPFDEEPAELIPTINSVKGFKGFDKELKCYNYFKYEIGKTYETTERIALCNFGFHFCRDLKHVDTYFTFSKKSNRYCEVEALGLVLDGPDKSVTNKIKIVREITREEIIKLQNEPFWEKAAKIQEEIPNLLIGGSMALMLAGHMEEREFTDLDVIVPNYISNHPEIRPNTGKKGSARGVDMIWDGEVKVDFFIQPKTKWTTVVRNGVTFKVSDIEPIIQAKVNYALSGGSSAKKHAKDLAQIFASVGGLNKKNNIINLMEEEDDDFNF